jgi:hypothetical protein
MVRDDIWIEEDEQPRRSRSALAVLAIAAVPWLIVAAVVLRPAGDDEHPRGQHGVSQANPTQQADRSEDAPDVDEARPTADLDGAVGAPAAPSDTAPTDEVQAETSRGPDEGAGSETASGSDVDRTLAATATVVARAWATGVDPHLDVAGVEPAHGPRYAEHVAVEAIERSGPELAVVTLLAIVLEEFDDGLGADLRRIAVPLAIEGGAPRLAGSPWWLPSPELHRTHVQTHAETDPVLLDAAAQAVSDAGYDDVELLALHRTETWPWIAEISAVAPGGESVEGPVWLREGEDRFVLAGQPPSGQNLGGGTP